jgi:hypothetical protein
MDLLFSNKLLIYCFLRNLFKNITINKLQPAIKNTPPNGVINQIDFAVIPVSWSRYIDPENREIPAKNKKLILFF